MHTKIITSIPIAPMRNDFFKPTHLHIFEIIPDIEK
jgi:hypothetical protein